MAVRLAVLFPLPLGNVGISHICLSVARNMRSPEFHVRLIVPKASKSNRLPFVSEAAPFPLRKLPFRYFPAAFMRSSVRVLLHQLQEADAVYLWSEVPIALSRKLHESGIPVIREKFNCHKLVSNQILADAYQRLGWPQADLIADEFIEKEDEELALADYIFVANPNAARSLLEQGVPERKLLRSTYGWDPQRIRVRRRREHGNAELVYLFVGRGCVRKGVPFLLEAWKRAQLPGRLILSGAVDREIVTHCGHLINRDNVTLLGHTHDISKVYEIADVFVFPSLEEGGPLVIFEAMAQGLPSIVSKMGGGGVMRHGTDGLEVDAMDVDGIAEALHALAANPDLRSRMGEAAQLRALDFTWELVGRRRRESVQAVLTCAGRYRTEA